MENQEFTPAPDNHLVKAILTMIFCCMPFGIVSLINATKVESLWTSGQKEQAQQAAQKADKWANIALICGIVEVGISFLILIICLIIDLA